MVPENEYNPYFKSFIEDLSSNGKSIVENLKETGQFLEDVVSNLSKEKELYRYAEGKWTIKELLLHIIDTERIFNYRALRFSRNDKTDVQGFEQDEYNDHSNANERELQNLLDEFKAVRLSTIALYQGLSDEALLRMGTASGNAISVRALGFITSGHQIHHIRVFQERYL
ncbi:MAG: DinB family protein [Flavobacteriaceae bacterium]